MVSDAGDINGDGIDDLSIGAPLVSVGELQNAGAAYVVFGRDERSLDLDDYIRAAGEVTLILRGDALTGGAAEVGMLNVEVPENAVYGSINPIALESVQINNNNLNAIGDKATHLVAHLGDANGDGQLTPSDAIAISYLAAGIDTELGAYSGVNPLLVADLNDDGIISAFDASLVI